MTKRPPSLVQIAVMVAFALSCLGILLYVWQSFGGQIPLAPKGYRVVAGFNEATTLSDTAEVRISGVRVGRVVLLSEHGGRTQATMQIDPRYAPIARDTRAILRLKTLLGETYIELTPGDRRSGLLPDGGRIPNTQIGSTTELDEVTRALDARTRRDLQHFLHGLAVGLAGRGQDLNDALGNLPPFTDSTTALLRALDSQDRAVRKLVSDSGVLAPQLYGLFGDVDKVIAASKRGAPALTAVVRAAHPALRLLVPLLREAQPVVDYLGLYKEELVSQIAGVAAATQASAPVGTGQSLHYARVIVPFTAEGAAAQYKRLTTNRLNPYFLPLALNRLKQALLSFDCSNVKNGNPGVAQAPPCLVQPPLHFRGRATAYPHVHKDK